MIDERCENLEIKSKLKGSYYRDEEDGHFLLIPPYGSYNEALLMNGQGNEIVTLIRDGVKTPGDIVTTLRSRYPEAEEALIKKDVYAFLNVMRAKELISIRGADKMYQGKTIATIGDYSVYRCLEGDLKMINSVLGKKDVYAKFQYTDTYNGIYAPVYTRGRVFAYIEDFYVLKTVDGDVACMLSFFHGRGVFNGIPLVGVVVQSQELPQVVLKEFIQECLKSFKREIEPDAAKVRIKMPIDNGRLGVLADTFEQAGFEKKALLENELGLNRDAVIYDYLY